MPTNFIIPPKRESHCEPCAFHKLTGSLHVRSGEGGYRRYACMHPDAFDFSPIKNLSEEQRQMAKDVDAFLKKDGRDIGKTDLQPDWCPLKMEQQ